MTVPSFDSLAAFDGDPGAFWPQWCAFAKERFAAQGACLLLRAGQGAESIRVVAQDRPQTAHRVVATGVLHVDVRTGPASYKRTPLHCAATCDASRAVGALLAAGASLAATDAEG